MDLTFNSTKSVGIARELAGPDNAGDPRIEEAHREAVRYAMGFVECDIRGRVRVGGKDEDRVTGNMVEVAHHGLSNRRQMIILLRTKLEVVHPRLCRKIGRSMGPKQIGKNAVHPQGGGRRTTSSA